MIVPVCVVAFALSVADEFPVEHPVAEGLRAMEIMEFENAIALLVEGLEDSALSVQQRVVALVALARAHAILMQSQRAVERFVQVLGHNPNFALGRNETPRVRAALREARATVAKAEMVVATEAPHSPGSPDVERARLSDGSDQGKGASWITAPVAKEDESEISTSTWLWIGGGVLAATIATVVAALVASQPDEPNKDWFVTWDLP